MQNFENTLIPVRKHMRSWAVEKRTPPDLCSASASHVLAAAGRVSPTTKIVTCYTRLYMRSTFFGSPIYKHSSYDLSIDE